MNQTKIIWPWNPPYTINPVIGCSRNPQCSYCYARKMNARFGWNPEWTKPQYFPERLNLFKKLKSTDSCFVDSMSDVAFWKPQWKIDVSASMAFSDCENYLLLSKSPTAYDDIQWPRPCQLGLTITGQEKEQGKMLNYLLDHTGSNTCFVSIEPLLGKITLDMKTFYPEDSISWFIVGADSNRGAKPPKPEWIQSVRDNVPAEKIFWKENIKKYL